MTVSFQRSTRLPVPPEVAFDASLDVDFHVESFAHTGEQIVGGVTGGLMAHGDTVTWRARHFGIWWRMTSVISEFDRPHHFVDEQQKGPFKAFRHEHRFEADGAGGTLMTDVVVFDAPFGVLGTIAEKLVLKRYMAALIDARNTFLAVYLSRAEAK